MVSVIKKKTTVSILKMYRRDVKVPVRVLKSKTGQWTRKYKLGCWRSTTRQSADDSSVSVLKKNNLSAFRAPV